jgi:hypothetical protein
MCEKMTPDKILSGAKVSIVLWRFFRDLARAREVYLAVRWRTYGSTGNSYRTRQPLSSPS